MHPGYNFQTAPIVVGAMGCIPMGYDPKWLATYPEMVGFDGKEIKILILFLLVLTSPKRCWFLMILTSESSVVFLMDVFWWKSLTIFNCWFFFFVKSSILDVGF